MLPRIGRHFAGQQPYFPDDEPENWRPPMNELTEALNLVHDLIESHGTDFAAWRLYRLERLLHTVRQRYFLDTDDVAVPAEEDDELVELTADGPFPAA